MKDPDANNFARIFYSGLARRETPAHAVAAARRQMLAEHIHDQDRKAGRHWHLARLHVGPDGGGALCTAQGDIRKSHRGATEKAFLDKKRARIPVAAPTAFVGRRREAQTILRVYREQSHPGVLIRGFGGQGKSSLAARIADRLPQHQPVVVFGDYDARAIFDAVIEAVPADERGPYQERWLEIIDKPGVLRNALEVILTGPCRAYDPAQDRQPLLLIIDDLEQALEDPSPNIALTPVKAIYEDALRETLDAFARLTTASHLLLTSRYSFTLADKRGHDLAADLFLLPLNPFDEQEQARQQRVAHRERGEETTRANDQTLQARQNALLQRARTASRGNALVLARLTDAVLTAPDIAEEPIAEMESYLERGDTPDNPDLLAIFQRIAFPRRNDHIDQLRVDFTA